MSFLEIIFVAIGLAMDCFAVSIICGLILKKFQFRPIFRIAFMFGFFQAIMPLIGWFLGKELYDYICHYDHWIAFGILGILGIKMIYDEFHPDNNETKKIDPYRWKVVLSLSIATSIDALSVGISFPLLGVNVWSCILPIGIASFVISWLGALLSIKFGNRIHIKAELIGGIMLIVIGTKTLLEHLLA